MKNNFVRAIVVDPTTTNELSPDIRKNHMLVVLKRLDSGSAPKIIEPDTLGATSTVSDGRVRFYTGDTPAYFLKKMSDYFDLLRMARDRAVVLSLLTGLHFYSAIDFSGISGNKEGDFHILLPGDSIEMTVNIKKPDGSDPSSMAISTVFSHFKIEVASGGGSYTEVEQESVFSVTGSTINVKVSNNSSTTKALYGICIAFE